MRQAVERRKFVSIAERFALLAAGAECGLAAETEFYLSVVETHFSGKNPHCPLCWAALIVYTDTMPVAHHYERLF